MAVLKEKDLEALANNAERAADFLKALANRNRLTRRCSMPPERLAPPVR